MFVYYHNIRLRQARDAIRNAVTQASTTGTGESLRARFTSLASNVTTISLPRPANASDVAVETSAEIVAKKRWHRGDRLVIDSNSGRVYNQFA
jgi:hypothetical protein